MAEALYRAHDPTAAVVVDGDALRVNAQSAAFEEALTRLGVPYRVRGAAAFLDRPEVKTVIEALRKGAKTAPGRTFAEHLTDLVADANALSEDRREHVDAVAALGREYLAAEGSTGSVKGFLDYLRASLRGGDDGGLADDAVDLLTFHRAKGLEWDTVFVVGLERGLVPISHASGKPDALDEERRLLYVALQSRRAVPAPLVGEGTRTGHADLSANQEPVPQRDRQGRRRLPGGGQRRPRTTREPARPLRAQRLAALEHGEIPMSDRPLYDALVSWRRELARAAAVPPYVILDNKTLRKVATSRPRSSDALLALPGIGPGEARALRGRTPGSRRPPHRLTPAPSGRTMKRRTG